MIVTSNKDQIITLLESSIKTNPQLSFYKQTWTVSFEFFMIMCCKILCHPFFKHHEKLSKILPLFFLSSVPKDMSTWKWPNFHRKVFYFGFKYCSFQSSKLSLINLLLEEIIENHHDQNKLWGKLSFCWIKSWKNDN